MSKEPEIFKGETPWGEHKLPEGRALFFRLGNLNLWCEKEHNEFWVACQHVGNTQTENTGSALPADITWSRWLLKNLEPTIRLVPVFPDKSIVVKPEYAFRIIQGASAKIFIRVPVWLRIEQAKSKGSQFTEVPSVTLVKTWFGTVTKGELCYWVTTSASRQVEMDPDKSHFAICPIRIVNHSDEDLDVDKLALQVRYLTLFQEKRQLWADEMKIEYRGKDDVSRIRVTEKAPEESAGARLISAAREPLPKSLAQKTFSSLRDLPGLDFFSK